MLHIKLLRRKTKVEEPKFYLSQYKIAYLANTVNMGQRIKQFIGLIALKHGEYV